MHPPAQYFFTGQNKHISSPLAFTGCPIGFAPATQAGWGFVIRYRSATVTDFHGLPCCFSFF